MKENFEFFEKILPDILPKHHNEYVVIKNQRVVAYYPTYGSAFHGAIEKGKLGEFIIQRVCDKSEGVAAFHSPVLG